MTIPPDILSRFKNKAEEICRRAKLDALDMERRPAQLLSGMERTWLEAVEEHGLSNAVAEKRVIESFDEDTLVKMLKLPWCWRILIYQRHQSGRMWFFLMAFILYSWLAVLDVHYRAHMDGKPADLPRLMLPYDLSAIDPNERYPSFGRIVSALDLEYFVNGMGTFFVGLAAVASVFVIRWDLNFKDPLLKRILLLRYVMSLIPLFAAATLAVGPTYLTWCTFEHYTADVYYQSYCLVHLGAILLGWFGAACLLSELFDCPRWMRNRQATCRQTVMVL